MSLGGGAYDSSCDLDPRKTIIDQLRAAKIATVIATGNNGPCNYVAAPSCISSAISVGASDKNDSEASYNNYHPSLQDFFAPGSEILSATSTTNSSYESWNGTSMATPHIAGAVALLRGAFPEAGVTKIEGALKKHGTNLIGLCQGATAIPRINVDVTIQKFSFPWMMFIPAMTAPASP
jgi:subtilisin family serine protease